MKPLEIHRDLIEGCLRGERKSQFELYKAYSKAMFNISRRIVQDDQEAEDVLQEAFVEAFRKMHTFKGKSTIGAWIKRIVINKSINLVKKRRIRFDDLSENTYRIPIEKHYVHDHSLSVKRINNALSDLPQGYRTVFSLYAIEGYDHEEIAQILDISSSTSKSQYSRARRKLKENLEGQKMTEYLN